MNDYFLDSEQIECSLEDYSDNQNPYDLDAILFGLDENNLPS